LKAYRNAQEPPISQVEAARRFGISQAEWSRLERGIHRPNARLTKKLIEQTGASLEILMRVAS
jgi:transcriptional regulator with XRE-family HTH domain